MQEVGICLISHQIETQLSAAKTRVSAASRFSFLLDKKLLIPSFQSLALASLSNEVIEMTASARRLTSIDLREYMFYFWVLGLLLSEAKKIWV